MAKPFSTMWWAKLLCCCGNPWAQWVTTGRMRNVTICILYLFQFSLMNYQNICALHFDLNSIRFGRVEVFAQHLQHEQNNRTSLSSIQLFFPIVCCLLFAATALIFLNLNENQCKFQQLSCGFSACLFCHWKHSQQNYRMEKTKNRFLLVFFFCWYLGKL